jgi:hypothetical protein
MKNWFSNLGKATQVATAVITFVTLGGLLWVGYGKLTDWIGPDAKKETPWLGLQVWQDGAPNDVFVMGDDELERKVEVPMARKPFQIRLPQLEADSGIHICAWTDDSIFEAKIGMETEPDALYRQVPTEAALEKAMCVQVGGMATTEAMAIETLFLTKDGSNYYAGDRMATVRGQNRIYVQKVWRVHSPKQQPIPLEHFDQDIFLLAFIDTDDDKIIDVDEYQYLVLRFQE